MSILAIFGKVTVSFLALLGALFIVITIIAVKQAPQYQPAPSNNITVSVEDLMKKTGLPFKTLEA